MNDTPSLASVAVLYCREGKDEDIFVDVLSSGKFMFPLPLLIEFLLN